MVDSCVAQPQEIKMWKEVLNIELDALHGFIWLKAPAIKKGQGAQISFPSNLGYMLLLNNKVDDG
eukprot:scaffold5850_cov110-Cylindrotheca_fusiformis.AAC.3